MDQHRAATADPLAPLDDVGTGRTETVGAVDVEQVDLALHIIEGGIAHLADMGHALIDTRSREVGVEEVVVVVAAGLVGLDFLRPAIGAHVRVDRRDRHPIGSH